MATAAVFVVTVILAVLPARGASSAPGRYPVDKARSEIGFRVSNFGFPVEGRFTLFDGRVELAEPFERTRVEGTVKVESIQTGIRKRDKHLLSPDFFDAAAFPEMSFKSVQITGTPESFEMEGDLTIRGVTKRVRFTGKTADAAGEGIAVIAKTAVDRRDFGLSYGSTIGKRVTIVLKVVAGTR
ncbi:MAG: YceI family protein [Candidatus Omnitrophota bacterium]|nr:YceI family protein [Candidatus Omnitrophota bacterium]